MSKSKPNEETGATTESLNTEAPPTHADVQQIPCALCKWFEKRLTSTLKEQIRHMEKFHLN